MKAYTPPPSGCFPNAKKVKIQSITGEPLHMFEVKVLSSGSNVASGKSASQDSTFKGNSDKFGALKAVDGKEGTFSHTEVDACGWWEVDLGGAFAIESVKIMNRWCGNPTDSSNCLCRLSHAAVSLEDENGNWVDTVVVGDTCGQLEVVHEFGRSDEYCNFVPTEFPTFSPTIDSKWAIDLCAKYKTSLQGNFFMLLMRETSLLPATPRRIMLVFSRFRVLIF
jgi:hypothetical protein